MTGPKNSRAASRRRAPDALLLVALDPSSPRPLHRQAYDGLRDAILAGRLAPGARLPSTRALAADLGVARNTVALAFDQLRAEGYVEGRRGGGTRVRGELPDGLLNVRTGDSGLGTGTGGAAPRSASDPSAARRRTTDVQRPTTSPQSRVPSTGLSHRGSALASIGDRMARRGGRPAVPFRLGIPAIEQFPAGVWARLSARRWRRGEVFLGDADPGGERELRAAIAAYVSNARGARCAADQVIVVSGTQQAVDLVARTLLDPGEAAWMEEPGYTVARGALLAAGARVVPVRVDDEGLDVAAGERAAPDARLAYVTPSHQFPLGAVMSARRRLELLAWARRAGAWIAEDDYDSEFRYAGRPLPCLQGLDASARVIYIGTFSKALVPGIRLAYLVAPDGIVDALRAVRSATDRHPSTLSQGVLADFIGEGHYARHVRRVRQLYAERQAALLAAAERELGGLLTLAPDPAGLHLVGWLPPGSSDLAAAEAASAAGVEVYPLSRFWMTPPRGGRQGLVLSYAGFDERAIRRGVGKLAVALRGES